ncbi:MAG TPA: protein kinase [Pseudomonadota bacterium]|nr:protein kinase [Pseudomonadota bacterium]
MIAVLSRTFTLGRYTCVERLGQSPVGEVWRAKRFGLAGLDRQYLVYRIGASQIAQDSTANLRLQAALRSVSEIQHQNLLHIEEFGSQSGDQFVAYEFVGFADLGKLKSGVDLLGDEAKSLLPQIVALIGQQLARALLAAQERGVMHGMLSPSCIWISPGGDAHIAELGLWAVLPQGPWKLDGALKSLGPYVAPELLDSGVPGPRSDVFALGSLLAEQLKLVSQDKLSPDSKSAQSSLQTICQRAMEKSAGQRPSSMLELIKQLDAVRVTEAAPAQLARFGQLFELAGDTVPQPVTTSDRSAAEPLPPPPSMKIAVGKTPAKPPEKAAAKDAVGSEKAAPQDKADAADGKAAASPVTINPRAAFGAGMAGNGASAVTPTADVDAAEAELAGGDGKNKPALPARLRPSTPPPDTDHISVTDTNPAMMPLPKAKRTTAKPSKAVGDEPTNQFKLEAAEAALAAEQAAAAASAPAADPPVSDPSTLEASELLEENPALNSTGNYSQPELPPVTPEIAAAAGMSQSPSGSPSAPAVEPSPPPESQPRRLSPAAFAGIGLGAAVVAGGIMFALIGGNSTSNSVISDGGAKDGMTSTQDVVAKLPSDEIQVDSSPSAAVFLDGESKGKAPLKLKVKAGTHKLLIVADSFKLWKQEASGGQTISAKLIKASLPDDVSGTAAVKVKCKRDGELRILVDGNDSGLSCPTDDLMLKPGKYTLGFLSPTSDELREKSIKVKKKGLKLKVKF